MDRFAFDFSLVRQKIRESGKDVSFSRVIWTGMAPRFGLEFHDSEEHLSSFNVGRARLSNSALHDIVSDVNKLSLQFGRVNDTPKEEARSRHLQGYLNSIVALFAGVISNTPHELLDGLFARKGRIEQQFLTCGHINVLFLQLKRQFPGGRTPQLLNWIAQLIAESEACSFQNLCSAFPVPIVGLLADVQTFYFFEFTRAPDNPFERPALRMGKLPDRTRELVLKVEGEAKRDIQELVRSTRKLCDTLYWLFLRQYLNGLTAYIDGSLKKTKKTRKSRDSTDGWQEARNLAAEALDVAVRANSAHGAGDIERGRKMADDAHGLLRRSVEKAPRPHAPVMAGYTEDMADL